MSRDSSLGGICRVREKVGGGGGSVFIKILGKTLKHTDNYITIVFAIVYTY